MLFVSDRARAWIIFICRFKTNANHRGSTEEVASLASDSVFNPPPIKLRFFWWGRGGLNINLQYLLLLSVGLYQPVTLTCRWRDVSYEIQVHCIPLPVLCYAINFICLCATLVFCFHTFLFLFTFKLMFLFTQIDNLCRQQIILS